MQVPPLSSLPCERLPVTTLFSSPLQCMTERHHTAPGISGQFYISQRSTPKVIPIPSLSPLPPLSTAIITIGLDGKFAVARCVVALTLHVMDCRWITLLVTWAIDKQLSVEEIWLAAIVGLVDYIVAAEVGHPKY